MGASVIAVALAAVGVAWGDSLPSLPADPALGDELQKAAGEGFRLRETDHFTIAYDMSYETLRSMTGRLEGTFDAVWGYCEDRKFTVVPPARRLGVIFFDRHGRFSAFAHAAGVDPGTTAGFYSQRTDRSAFGNTLNWPDVARVNVEIEDATRQLGGLRGESAAQFQAQIAVLKVQRDAFVKRFNRLVLQHEAAHHLLFNIGVHVRGGDNPPWLVEGLACQFEVPQATAVTKRTRVNQLRLADFREALGVGADVKKPPAGAWRAAVEAGRLVPAATLVSDGALFEKRDEMLSFRYAQSWALVYFLDHENRTAWADYVNRLARRAPGAVFGDAEELAEFSASFGPVDGEFETRWATFMLRLRVEADEGE